jgi:hypothetical protein
MAWILDPNTQPPNNWSTGLPFGLTIDLETVMNVELGRFFKQGNGFNMLQAGKWLQQCCKRTQDAPHLQL